MKMQTEWNTSCSSRSCETFIYVECECNPDGSEALQCDPVNGQCPCVEGITGLKCDRCDRGTTGELPNCVPCGECFDNWDAIVKDLKSEFDYQYSMR